MEPITVSSLAFIWITILLFAGGFVCGWLIRDIEVHKWKMRWIILEHDTAKELGREPRKIDNICCW